jgi:hypothetical protein
MLSVGPIRTLRLGPRKIRRSGSLRIWFRVGRQPILLHLDTSQSSQSIVGAGVRVKGRHDHHREIPVLPVQKEFRGYRTFLEPESGTPSRGFLWEGRGGAGSLMSFDGQLRQSESARADLRRASVPLAGRHRAGRTTYEEKPSCEPAARPLPILFVKTH